MSKARALQLQEERKMTWGKPKCKRHRLLPGVPDDAARAF
jgi:hypothetical protein